MISEIRYIFGYYGYFNHNTNLSFRVQLTGKKCIERRITHSRINNLILQFYVGRSRGKYQTDQLRYFLSLFKNNVNCFVKKLCWPLTHLAPVWNGRWEVLSQSRDITPLSMAVWRLVVIGYKLTTLSTNRSRCCQWRQFLVRAGALDTSRARRIHIWIIKTKKKKIYYTRVFIRIVIVKSYKTQRIVTITIAALTLLF